MGHDHVDIITRSNAIEQVLRMREQLFGEHRTELVSLDAIAGRTVAEPIVAEQDVPANDFATMDGYAFDATDEYPLTVVEHEVFPEDESPSIGDGEAVAIATGAPLPHEANAVLKREEATLEGDQLRGTAVVPGTYTYQQGSNVRAGERLFDAGERLSPKDTILLGDIGYESVTVTERLSVGVLATGTEIHEGRTADLDSPMLMGLVRSWGHEASYEGTVPDDSERVEERISELARRYDVVLTTGGTSVGHKDYVIHALDELGEVLFHRVSIRPGKPIALARLPDAIVVAIPGKPLGAHTVTSLVVRPLFTGETHLPTVSATFARDLAMGPEGFEYIVPVTLDTGDAMPLGHVDSQIQVYENVFDPSVLSSSTRATRADGFVITERALDSGQQVDVVPYQVVE